MGAPPPSWPGQYPRKWPALRVEEVVVMVVVVVVVKVTVFVVVVAETRNTFTVYS